MVLTKAINFAQRITTFGFFDAIKLTFFEQFRISKVIGVKVGGNQIFVRTSTPDYRVAALNLSGEFELLRYILPPDFEGVIVDAGGYIGTAAIKFSEMYPCAKIVTVEPVSANFKILERNIEDFNNITAVKAALVPRHLEDISISDRGTGPWGYTIVDRPLDNPSSQSIEKARAITLAEICQMFDVPDIGLLKLDIEGGEKELFEYGSEALQAVFAVFVELHDRIIDGCSESFRIFSEDRIHLDLGGEKQLSVRVGSTVKCKLK
jgi:FkbM family methyltransferase